MIQNVGTQAQRYTGSTALQKPEEKPTQSKADSIAAEKETKKNEDTFVKEGTSKPVTYSKNQLSGTQAKQLMDDAQKRVDAFQMMLEKMFVRQGQQSNLSLFGMQLNVSSADSAKAAASIAEGGEYSVDAVAGRLIDMAKALSGGDESKIAVLREAVEKGFAAAGVEIGGKLPDICGQTYDEVMKRFDDWENEGKTQTE